ncbi:hypothetical protein [Streptomyces goshikiensis]
MNNSPATDQPCGATMPSPFDRMIFGILDRSFLVLGAQGIEVPEG